MHENILVWLILWLLNVLSFQHVEYFMNYTLGSLPITVELSKNACDGIISTVNKE